MSELMVTQGQALMPVLELGQVIARYNYMKELVSRVMVEGLHYGKVPGTDRDTLLKPGAEMLTTVFGLVAGYEISEAIEQWDAAEPFFYYRIHCRLYHAGQLVGEGDGSCNSREGRYRYRWVDESDVPPELDKDALKKRGGKATEPQFAVERGQTQGKYGKPEEYWQAFRDAIQAGTAEQDKMTSKDGRVMKTWIIDRTVYRVPNEDIFSQVNTILKMAEKRALVAATLVTTNASDFFTQDMEDLVEATTVTVINPEPTPAPKTQEPPAPEEPPDLDYDGQPLPEAKREAESVEPPTVDLDYVPDWIDTDEKRLFGKLSFEAVQHLGYSHDKHVENTIKAMVPDADDRARLTYRAAWNLLAEHKRSEQAEGEGE